MALQLPDKTTAFKVYHNGNYELGIATVDLPEIAYVTDTLSGAGIAGELDTPVQGHFQSMQTTLHFRTVTAQALSLLQTTGGTITLMASQQDVDTGAIALVDTGLKIVIKYLPHTVSLGTEESGASTDTSVELEVTYLKIEIEGRELVEIDKLNYKHVVDGVDLLANVRRNVGMY